MRWRLSNSSYNKSMPWFLMSSVILLTRWSDKFAIWKASSKCSSKSFIKWKMKTRQRVTWLGFIRDSESVGRRWQRQLNFLTSSYMIFLTLLFWIRTKRISTQKTQFLTSGRRSSKSSISKRTRLIWKRSKSECNIRGLKRSSILVRQWLTTLSKPTRRDCSKCCLIYIRMPSSLLAGVLARPRTERLAL